jgi:L-threonylcarbamoyladenylate synthase
MVLTRLSDSNGEDALSSAAAAIAAGGIAAFPTETYYGLGVRYDDAKALEKLYKLKGRPKDRAMPLIIGGAESLGLVTPAVSAMAQKLMERFWPGPLTILLDARKDLPELITAGTGKVAVRVPGASFALELAHMLAFPITSTSANISGMPAADNADKVIEYFGDSIDILIDGGKTRGGKPSTIVEIRNGRITILREGQISEDEIMRAVKT